MIRRFDEVSTPRLLMRRWREEDREPFAAMNADPEVMRYFPAVLDRAESDALVDRIELHLVRHGFGLWALELRATGDLLGFTGLNPMPDGVPGAGGYEIGWRLARGAWHQGFATEAARAALDVGLGSLGLPEIWSMTALVNTPSQAVMRRLGMRRHGEFDHPRVPEGPLRRHVLYRLAADEARRPAPAAEGPAPGEGGA
ncbi:GNAT family N-acetyltransferase [Georgenia sp. AZ-5]|uniref:GNAT family N-acetyltransferase n=1 Tax=Georgenia sp. AZ-5 TaxID=3367526 RepID=UPI003754CBA3